MFDFRYHALSLIAVLIALAVGLLLGVAIGDQGLVSSAEKDLRHSLERNVVKARAQAADARTKLEQRQRIEERSFYPVMVNERLSGTRIGLIGLGAVPDQVVENVRDGLQDTGGRLVSVSVLGEPLDLQAIGDAAKGTPYADIADHPEKAAAFGRQIGEDFTRGGPLLARLRSELLQRGSSSGTLDGLEGVVLVRQGTAPAGTDAAVTRAFENGLIRGLDRRGVNVVGVETTDEKPSTIPWYMSHRVSSVDDVDLVEGRAALVFALAGERGTFGTKSTADALMPEVVGRTSR